MTRSRTTNVATMVGLLVRCALACLMATAIVRAQSPPGERRGDTQTTGVVRVLVTDATTGAPLPDAVVRCGTAVPTVADQSGVATVPACASGLDVTREGYAPAHLGPPLPLPLPDPLVVGLVPERRATETVTVVGPAAGEPEAAVPAQIAISRDELAMLRSVTFDDPIRALQQLPGVATSDELRAELSVRGSPFRQVGLVLDEVKSRLLVHTVRGVEQTGSVALLNADLLDAATLTPGAGPQRFGNTVGAELGIRTRSGRADGFHGRAMASAIAATGFVEGPVGTDRIQSINFRCK